MLFPLQAGREPMPRKVIRVIPGTGGTGGLGAGLRGSCIHPCIPGLLRGQAATARFVACCRVLPVQYFSLVIGVSVETAMFEESARSVFFFF